MTGIGPAHPWSIGYQVTGGPATYQSAHEEVVGTNWYEAVDRLCALANEWATNDDPRPSGSRPEDSTPPDWRPVTSDQLAAAWEAAPPVYAHDAAYELTSSEGVEIRFYLTRGRP